MKIIKKDKNEPTTTFHLTLGLKQKNYLLDKAFNDCLQKDKNVTIQDLIRDLIDDDMKFHNKFYTKDGEYGKWIDIN